MSSLQSTKALYGAVLAAAGIAVSVFTPDVALAQAGAALEEIVVTARKREESLQDTPIAVSAFSAEGIEARGIVSTDQIAQFTPNLSFQNSPGYGGSTNTGAIYIRGIGQFDFLGSIEPGVGMYVDGVYVARSLGAVMDLVDVERIEILRGPQGTLFGRNTIGGALNIVTRKPTDQPELSAEFTYGDDDYVIAKGTASGPLLNNLYGKVSVRFADRDGYVEQVATGSDFGNKDNFATLAQLNWEPDAEFSVGVSFDYTRDRSHGPPWVLRGWNSNSRVFNPNNLSYVPPRSASPFSVDGSIFPFIDVSTLLPATSVPGAAGALATGAAFLPPGVDPAGPFYELNIQPLSGAIPGIPIAGVLFPNDAPVDNFPLLNNWAATFPAPGGPAPVQCISPPFGPYDPTFIVDDACFSERFFEGNLGKNKNAGTFPTFSANDIFGISGTIDWNVGPVRIVSITGYRNMNANFNTDYDMSPLQIAHLEDWFDQWQISQELQFKGLAFEDRLNWIVGGYYFKEEVDNQNDVHFTPVSVRSGGLIENESSAAFAQGTYSVTDQLHLTVGFRYTKDEKTFDSGPYQYIFESRTPVFLPCSLPTVEGCPVYVVPPLGSLTVYGNRKAAQSASEWTPYVNLAYDWTDSLMTYFSYSEGFKSGGFTQRIFPPTEEAFSVDPEFVTVYEGGFKSEWYDQRLRLNGAIFYTDYTDLQVQGFTVETGIAPIYRNAAAARVIGFELELQASPAEGWFVEGALGFMDDKYKEISADVIGLTEDNRFERVSKWTASAGLQKEFQLDNEMGLLVPRVDVGYRSKFYNDASNIEQISQDGYAVVNGSLRWNSANEHWTFIGGVKNIFDEDYIETSVFNANLQLYSVVPNRGREWSLTLRWNY